MQRETLLTNRAPSKVDTGAGVIVKGLDCLLLRLPLAPHTETVLGLDRKQV